jgi:cytochrome c oxidase assembly factor 6
MLMRRQVTYFKKRRVMEHQRDATLKKLNAEGATPMDTTGGAAAGGATALKGN